MGQKRDFSTKTRTQRRFRPHWFMSQCFTTKNCLIVFVYLLRSYSTISIVQDQVPKIPDMFTLFKFVWQFRTFGDLFIYFLFFLREMNFVDGECVSGWQSVCPSPSPGSPPPSHWNWDWSDFSRLKLQLVKVRFSNVLFCLKPAFTKKRDKWNVLLWQKLVQSVNK